MTRRIFAICASALLLASCGDSEDAVESNDTRETGPQGEVLGGSITDSMLPIAMVQSQSPKRGGEDGENGEDASENGEASQDGADDAE
jgi:PBP1b-binding outer membrane lipoprotein LpoB|tara:strand:- start:548 stop:811 length:264 start_codon:yes stop_codon:yes gene_type:complete